MSLKLYYTGASTFEGTQLDKDKSLGGLISSSEISNSLIGNLFGDISPYAVQLNKKEIRVFVIKNTALVTKSGLKVWISYPDNDDSESIQDDSLYEIGYGEVTANDCGDLTVEALTSIYATPYTVTFQSAVGQASALSLPDLTAGSYLGIFIRRILNPDLQQPLSDDDLLEILEGTIVQETQEDINLTFAWN